LAQLDPVAERRQPFLRQGQGRRISVEPEQTSVGGRPFEQTGSVTTGTDGAVQVAAAGTWQQAIQD
jgi:hypothetical protein